MLIVRAVFDFVFQVFNAKVTQYTYTEFLINFEGGFVRRGLMGQGLFEFCKAVGVGPIPVIIAFSVIMYAAVAIFFFRKFRERKLNWWYLLLPFTLGMTVYIIRKDYLTYGLTILILYALRSRQTSPLKIFLAEMLMIFGLFVHEAYLFYGIPICLLALYTTDTGRLNKIVCTAIPVITFLILSYFKGNLTVAHAIYDSWVPVINRPDFVYTGDNSIGAIGWDTLETFRSHFRQNFYVTDLGWTGLISRPVNQVVIYYFLVNFLYVLPGKGARFTKADQTAFSAVYLLMAICLLPMFTVLSCDIDRVNQYAAMGALTAFVVMPLSRLQAMFPAWWLRFVERINTLMNKAVVPTKGLIIIMIIYVNPFGNVFYSLLYKCLYAAQQAAMLLMS
ncbi:MAG: hypothetical protein HDS66_09965 [Bacteroidales bacterium]|nr:hypothetical protein [Bacteroidales bacterium]